jgi:hypothetical protein
MALPEDFDDLDHDEKLRVIENHTATEIRTEIDCILGIERAEYSGAQAHQFGKHELGLILRGLGGPQR